MFSRIVGATLIFIGMVATAGAVTLAVSANSNAWLAGMPAGATASLADVGSAQAPAQVNDLLLAHGVALGFSATGITDHCSEVESCGFAGAEGDSGEGSFRHTTGAENGIADLLAPIDSLIGVFLDSTQPDQGAAPDSLDFSTSTARDFASLSPLLKQPFFIGDGLRNDATTVQSFIVPAGATRLFLGTMDGFGWYNNTGSLGVTVTQLRELAVQVDEPATFVLAATSVIWMYCCRRRH